MDGIVSAATAQPGGAAIHAPSEIGNEGDAAIRSSTHVWCQEESCLGAESTQRITARIAEVTRAPISNIELLQLLRYGVGQQYRTHHDFDGGADEGAAGGRAYSLVLFLHTPDEGGELRFADVNLSVGARRGRAVLWPSLMDQDVQLPELRTHHASLPVGRGVKLAAVAWVRTHDWRTLRLERGCAAEPRRLQPPFALLPRYLAARAQEGLDAEVPPSMIERAREAASRGASGGNGVGSQDSNLHK